MEIDERVVGEKESILGLNNLKNLIKKKKDKPKFQNYTGQSEVADLETLFTGKSEKAEKNDFIKKEILPSLMFTFFSAKNVNIERKILKVIMRMFSQRDEMCRNLEKLEVIFNKEDLAIYNNLGEWIDEMRLLAQKSELWLDKFAANEGGKDEMSRINLLLSRMSNVFIKEGTHGPRLEKNR